MVDGRGDCSNGDQESTEEVKEDRPHDGPTTLKEWKAIGCRALKTGGSGKYWGRPISSSGCKGLSDDDHVAGENKTLGWLLEAPFVQVGPKKWCLYSGYEQEAADYYNFKFRPDDVVVFAYPRSGSTRTEEMVWLLANNLDYDTAKKNRLDERFPFLEYSIIVDKDVVKKILHDSRLDPVKYRKMQQVYYPRWKMLSEFQERRFFKTHLPFSLMDPNLLDVGCKVIYVARNPKDVAVSFYHLNKSAGNGYSGDFPTFWDYFERNLVPWTPYWEHIKEAWQRRHNKNMLFLFYEDMNRNLRSSLERVSNFLGKNYTNEEYEHLEEHLKIENFKQNPSVNYQHLKELKVHKENNFIRVGKTGGWGSYFDDELNTRADEWIRKNIEGSNIEFPENFWSCST